MPVLRDYENDTSLNVLQVNWINPNLTTGFLYHTTWTGALSINSNIVTGIYSGDGYVYPNTSTGSVYLYLDTWTLSSQFVPYANAQYDVISPYSFKATAGSGGSHYEYPYAYSYTLTYFPVTPSTIWGNASDWGSLNDDWYGNIYSSYYGQIATIDYWTGAVTDITGGYVSTNYIYYSYTIASTYAEIRPDGDINLSGYLMVGTGVKDSSGFLSIDSNARKLYWPDWTTVMLDYSDPFTTMALTGGNQLYQMDLNNAYFIDATGTNAIDWNNHYLYSTQSGNLSSMDWEGRRLFASDGTAVMFDYSTAWLADFKNNTIRTGSLAYAYMYEAPWASSYTLSNFPISPYSISGSASDWGYLSDDWYGGLYSSYYWQIATIDYMTGIVTDITSWAISTISINYTYIPAVTYAEILPNGNGTFTGDIEMTDFNKWVILTSPDSTRWRITIDNSGTLITTSL